MGQYTRGDVVLVSVPIDGRSGAKTRPAVVLLTGENGMITVCPVSSKLSTDAVEVPISLDDFSEGGLDLFFESYALTSRILKLRSCDVIGKKGRLTNDAFMEIAAHVPDTMLPATKTRNRPGKPGPMR